MEEEATTASYGRRLLHRWLVEYNPLYLLSATLVLGGMILTSRGLAREGSLYGELGVAAIAEVYAAALIGGAALLTRIGYRRPAVMLALLTVLYQCDLTLYTETCTYLGGIGTWATVGWLALFVVKLRALAWAMKLRISRPAFAVASLGAFGLAALPYYLRGLDTRAASAVVSLWLFTMFATFDVATRSATTATKASSTGGVTSELPLDDWGRTVLRRGVRAAWLLSSVLVVLHVMFWSSQRWLGVAALLPIAPLLQVSRVRREVHAWFIVATTLVVVAVMLPASFAVAALLSAAALALRAVSRVPSEVDVADTRRDPMNQPYRIPFAAPGEHSSDAPQHVPAMTEALFVPVTREEKMRLLTGALVAAYLGVWTVTWTGGPWPAHLLALDVVATAAVLLLLWRARVRIVLAPYAVGALHLVLEKHLVPAPRSLVQWGGTAVALGFALLIGSLVASYHLRKKVTAT